MTTTVTRALSGAVYVLLLVGATLYSPYSFLLLFGLLLLFSVGEFCKLVGLKPILPLLLATLGYILFNLDNTVKTNEILLLIAALLVSIRSLVFLFEKKNIPKNTKNIIKPNTEQNPYIKFNGIASFIFSLRSPKKYNKEPCIRSKPKKPTIRENIPNRIILVSLLYCFI